MPRPNFFSTLVQPVAKVPARRTTARKGIVCRIKSLFLKRTLARLDAFCKEEFDAGLGREPRPESGGRILFNTFTFWFHALARPVLVSCPAVPNTRQSTH